METGPYKIHIKISTTNHITHYIIDYQSPYLMTKSCSATSACNLAFDFSTFITMGSIDGNSACSVASSSYIEDTMKDKVKGNYLYTLTPAI